MNVPSFLPVFETTGYARNAALDARHAANYRFAVLRALLGNVLGLRKRRKQISA